MLLHPPLLTPVTALLPFSHHSSHRQTPPPPSALLVSRLTPSPAPCAPLSPPLSRGKGSGGDDSYPKRWGLPYQSPVPAVAKREGDLPTCPSGTKGSPFSCPHCRGRTSQLMGYDAGHEVFFFTSLWYKRQRIVPGENPSRKRFYSSVCIA